MFLASEKLNLNGSTVVLETDGTEITEDEVLIEMKNETLQLLQNGETWRKPFCDHVNCFNSYSDG